MDTFECRNIEYLYIEEYILRVNDIKIYIDILFFLRFVRQENDRNRLYHLIDRFGFKNLCIS